MQYRLAAEGPAPSGALHAAYAQPRRSCPITALACASECERVLRARDVAVRTAAAWWERTSASSLLDGGERVPADRFVWVTGPAAPRWLGDSGLRTDDRGVCAGRRLPALDLSSRSLCGRRRRHHGELRRARSRASYAVRQGPPLADNLRLVLRGQQPRVIRAAADGAPAHHHRRTLCHRFVGRVVRGGRLGLALERLDRPPVHGAVPCGESAATAPACSQSVTRKPRPIRESYQFVL